RGPGPALRDAGSLAGRLTSAPSAAAHALAFLIFVFFSTPPAPTALYTLSLHDALPIFICAVVKARYGARSLVFTRLCGEPAHLRSEEHTSELQSRFDLVCRLLLEKKKSPAPRRRPRRNLDMGHGRRSRVTDARA